MNILDIILAVPLLWSLYQGFRQGIIVQAGGLVGLFAGVWLAFRFGPKVGGMFGLEEPLATVTGFAAILVLVIIGLFAAGWLVRGLFRIAGLGMLDQLGGAVLSLLKMGLILGALLYGFTFLNSQKGWVEEENLEDSRLYGPLTGMAGLVFPYANVVKEMLTDADGNLDRNQGDARDQEADGTPAETVTVENGDEEVLTENDGPWLGEQER